MHCYAELAAPTAVTYSLSLSFTALKSKDLVVAKGSLLQIFSTKPVLAETLDEERKPAFDSTLILSAPTGPITAVNADRELDETALGPGAGPVESLRADRTQLTKLVLQAEIPLSGTIIGLARINLAPTNSNSTTKPTRGSRDALLIAFKTAKLCLAEWDPDKRGLESISIHYYEKDELFGAPWEASLADYVSYLEADPGSRCAALSFGIKNLAIIPFKQPADDGDIDMGDDYWDEDLDGPRPVKQEDKMDTSSTNGAQDAVPTKDAKLAGQSTDGSGKEAPFTPSFVLRLPQVDPTLIHPVHLAFLYEYREPTFGILSSTQLPSHSLGRRDHFSYKVFTLDLAQRASTTILSVEGLPQDLFRVIALPAPAGGALLVGCDELIHVDQSGRTNGVAVNVFARQSTSFALVDQAELNLRLEGCMIEPLSMDDGELLLVLSTGQLAIVTLVIDGRTVSGVSVRLVAPQRGGELIHTQVSSIARTSKTSFFLGSEDGDSHVLGYTRKHVHAAKVAAGQSATGRRKARVAADGSLEYTSNSDDDNDNDLELDLDDIDEDDDLYGFEGGSGADTQPGSASAGTQGISEDRKNTSGLAKGSEYKFRIHDSLLSLAPIRDMTCGKAAFSANSEAEKNATGVVAELQLACLVGRNQGSNAINSDTPGLPGAGAIAVLNREIQPRVVGRFDFAEARGFWTMAVQKPVAKAFQSEHKDEAGRASATDVAQDPLTGQPVDFSTRYDKYMIVSKVDIDANETSDVYVLTAAGFEALMGTEFEPAAGFTVEAGVMGKHDRIVQVLKSEVRCYDGDFGLSQILPMLDDETGSDPRIISASIADPYLLLVRDDASIFVAQMDSNLELEEMDRVDDHLLSTKWLSGCLYTDTHHHFDRRPSAVSTVYMFLLSAPGGLTVYALPNLSKPVYVADGLSVVPPYLSPSFVVRKGTARETLTEILVANLGDAIAQSPHLILRHANDDLTLYEPHHQYQSTSDNQELRQTLYFKKSTNQAMAKSPAFVADDTAAQQPRFAPLRPCHNIGGYATVFLPGASPSFIIKSAKSTPKVMGLQGTGVRGLSPFHTEGCERGFIYADSHGIARVTQLPSADKTNLAELGISVTKIPLGPGRLDPTCIAFHAATDTYVVASNRYEPFELPKDDDYHKEWAREQLSPQIAPLAPRGILQLIDAATWTTIQTLELEPCEAIECLKTVNMEISEETHERRLLVVAGTAIARGEDLPTRGRLHVFDIVSVIPHPERPETGHALKTVAREDNPRGAITALAEVGTQGLVLVAQGQKCMVRGLKEDGTLLPVAFMDMACYVTAVRELRGSGLCLMADAFRGLWFTGYTEEPYRMMLLGKSASRVEIAVADFLPDDLGQELAIVAADANGDVHFMEFNPEHPKSLQGHLLLHRTTFAAAPNPPTKSLLLPRTTLTGPPTSTIPNQDTPTSPQAHVLLLASSSGQLAAVTPLPSESVYRRLASLVNHLSAALPAQAGLNARAHRLAGPALSAAACTAASRGVVGVDASSTSSGGGIGGGSGGGVVTAWSGRNVVDGTVLARMSELAAGKHAEVVGKGGYDDDVVAARAEVAAVLGWGGLSYF